jgi:dolichol-phosphate mannosyltransferase
MISISIITPTYNEAGNILPLYAELRQALASVEWEVIFVDDSSDQTPRVIKTLVESSENVKAVLRTGKRGLSGAVLDGLPYAKHTFVCVMDSDLQHDPKYILQLHSELINESATISVGGRFVARDSMFKRDDSLPSARYLGSRLANGISTIITRGRINDAMSGYFLLRKDDFIKYASDISTDGFKILLDLISSMPTGSKIVEVPINFRKRYEGESKLDVRVLWEFLVLLIHRKILCFLPRRFISFLLVGFIGLFVHLIVLATLHSAFSLTFAAAQVLATITAIINNFLFNNILTYSDLRLRGVNLISGLTKYFLICSYGAIISFSIASTFLSINFPWLVAGLIGAVSASVWNFSVNYFVTWRSRSKDLANQTIELFKR